MIKIKYECDETGQEMNVLIAGVGTEQAEISIEFSPDISDETTDPFGVMGRVFEAIVPKKK